MIHPERHARTCQNDGADPKLISVKSFSCKNDDVSRSPTICVDNDLDNANSFYILLLIIL